MSQFVWEEGRYEAYWERFFTAQSVRWKGDPGRPDLTSWDFYGLTVLQGSAPAFRLDRSSEDVVLQPQDQFSISVLLYGTTTISAAGRQVTYVAGDLLMIDESEPYSIDAGETVFVSVLLPRRVILEQRPEIHTHLVTATRPDTLVAAMLSQLIQNLVRSGPPVATPADRAIHVALIALVIGTIELHGIRNNRTRQDAPLQKRVRSYVTAHLSEAELSPGRIATCTGISRSSLYRAFASTGGVSRFVQNCRIDAVRQCLADPDERRSISELALAFGFASTGHFSRVFRERTGRSPRDFRSLAKGETNGRDDPEGP